jgi:uncharacterized membrane protein (DUF373 family)
LVQEKVVAGASVTGTHRKRHAKMRLSMRHQGRHVIGLLQVAEDIVHYVVAIVLVGVAGVVLVHSVIDSFDSGNGPFAEQVTSVINSILFVIIVMEILRTVVAHFDDAGLQLKPFLIIGIISAIRHILTVGAQVSLGGEHDAEHFRQTQIELGVNAAVVIALVLGLVLVWRSEAAVAAGTGAGETDTTEGLP